MRSSIFHGEVSHVRLGDTPHAFRYPVYFYRFDLDDLPVLDRTLRLFGYNRRRVVALHDRDFLARDDRPIRTKLMSLLSQHGCADGVVSIELITSARFLNYVFNPVSFFICRREDASVRCVVAEVNNTFGESHVYVLDEHEPSERKGMLTFRHRKEFHVSPFNDMEGEYTFLVAVSDEEVDIRVNKSVNGQEVFQSRMAGVGRPLTATALRNTLFKYPFTAAMTFPRILAQAAKLYFVKRLPWHKKPDPEHPMTKRVKRPTLLERACMAPAMAYLRRIRVGSLIVELPNGALHRLGTGTADDSPTVRVRDYRLFRRLLLDGDIGLGESFTAGEWESDDVAGVLKSFADNVEAFSKGPTLFSAAGAWVSRMLHVARRNTRSGSRRNVQAHYDLSNDFFATFLDETMMYSCALHEYTGESLEEAQRRKMSRLIERAQITSSDHVLEIGSGWGGFAIEAALETGCRVTSITVSEEQHRYAVEKVREAGLEDRVSIELCDYRDARGSYDKIVSIEMLEAVGHAYFGTYFRALDHLLKPGGLAVIQVITIPDDRYEAYRKSCDWIQKHIFPGGFLPSLGAIYEAMDGHSEMCLAGLENVGPHYAETLRMWRTRFLERMDAVRDLGYDQAFIRKWIYYFCYCEAGFSTNKIDVLHLVMEKAGKEAPTSKNVRPREERPLANEVHV